ncbi:MAG: cation:dicarboxylase symporter family transporter [Limosilactobacillus oris]|nr:cation:dicarboxylase symporter family transporter [Megasphaera sp.]MCH3904074.1 cation:dicarboxylase symporter family transporter [Limosilactobacillus oris]MCH3930863.1 cation:dicarboxylase symporter family transporter [Megasphaera sp.]MCI1887159.1 cation:dicarboxylase symporter family transporter [Sporolactobacillus sp.]MCI1905419.1 cation:dicarboxylase symporter family transporter [Enterococcaceae bacterium]
MISDWRTVLFLAVLAVLFGLIHYLYHKCKMGFSLVVCVGMVAGALLGLVMQLMAGFPDDPTKVVFIKETTNWFQLFGNGYIDLIKMIVIPLVIISIAHVVINMDSGKTMSRLVKRTLLVTLVMTAIAAVIGIVFGILFDVGSGSAISSEAAKAKPKDVVSVASTLRALIPGNLVDSMVKNNVIGMVIFGAVFGRAIWWIKADKPDMEAFLHKLIDGLHKTMMNMALLILDYMPWAVIALLANTIAQKGLASILDVGIFIIALYVALIVQFIIQILAVMLHGVNPIHYLKKSVALLILAFTSRSSAGCLPVTIETLVTRLGVNQGTASFVAGFGTTAGMQGCAGVFPAMLIVYVCHLTGTPLDITMLVMTVIVVTIGSLGIAGIPGTATMAASVSLSGVGMASSFSLIGPILAIDPLIDMMRTMVNVSGSVTNSIMIDKQLGTLDMTKYNSH